MFHPGIPATGPWKRAASIKGPGDGHGRSSDFFNAECSRTGHICVINQTDMTTFGLFDILSIHDEAGMQHYRERVMATVHQYGGRYLAIGGPHHLLEGEARPTFPVLVEFPSMEQAQHWYDSPEYADLKALRQRSATANAFLLQGIQ